MKLFRMMNYNIRNQYGDTGLHCWDNRKAHLAAQIAARNPDIFCVQEAYAEQMDYLSEHLPEYAYYGVGRDDGVREGEHSAIFYKTALFTFVSGHTWWLSETPDVPSIGWDGEVNKRVCAKAILKCNDGSGEIAVGSLHLDHVARLAQKNGAALVREIFLPEVETRQCFIAGDYNVTPTSEAFAVMNQPPFYDARLNADESTDYDTYHGFRVEAPVVRHGPIDHIFYSKGALRPLIAEVLATKRGGQFPSDHFPFLCTFVAD